MDRAEDMDQETPNGSVDFAGQRRVQGVQADSRALFPPRGWRQTARQSQPNTRAYRLDLPRPHILCQECGQPAYRRSDCPRPPETRKSGCRRENRGTFLRD